MENRPAKSSEVKVEAAPLDLLLLSAAPQSDELRLGTAQ